MAAPMAEHKFHKLVTGRGYRVSAAGKEWKVVDRQGKTITHFAVRHRKGGKREVLGCYVRQFLQAIGEI